MRETGVITEIGVCGAVNAGVAPCEVLAENGARMLWPPHFAHFDLSEFAESKERLWRRLLRFGW